MTCFQQLHMFPHAEQPKQNPSLLTAILLLFAMTSCNRGLTRRYIGILPRSADMPRTSMRYNPDMTSARFRRMNDSPTAFICDVYTVSSVRTTLLGSVTVLQKIFMTDVRHCGKRVQSGHLSRLNIKLGMNCPTFLSDASVIQDISTISKN